LEKKTLIGIKERTVNSLRNTNLTIVKKKSLSMDANIVYMHVAFFKINGTCTCVMLR
jgi:hypothetical protein